VLVSLTPTATGLGVEPVFPIHESDPVIFWSQNPWSNEETIWETVTDVYTIYLTTSSYNSFAVESNMPAYRPDNSEQYYQNMPRWFLDGTELQVGSEPYNSMWICDIELTKGTHNLTVTVMGTDGKPYSRTVKLIVTGITIGIDDSGTDLAINSSTIALSNLTGNFLISLNSTNGFDTSTAVWTINGIDFNPSGIDFSNITDYTTGCLPLGWYYDNNPSLKPTSGDTLVLSVRVNDTSGTLWSKTFTITIN
jgi:hypothetical protein